MRRYHGDSELVAAWRGVETMDAMRPAAFIAPDVRDLAHFVKTATALDLAMEIRSAVCRIETPDIMERARRTMSFLDDIPSVMQATFERGYFAGYLSAHDRADGEAIQ